MEVLVVVLILLVGVLSYKLYFSAPKKIEPVDYLRVPELEDQVKELYVRLSSSSLYSEALQKQMESINIDYGSALNKIDILSSENNTLSIALKEATEKIETITYQKKSSEVKTGLIAEQMAPFLSEFKYNPKNAHFLGRPIDFIVFDECGIHFVEVKSGDAQLSSSQRKIRDDIEQKRITFEVVRINGG